MPANRPAATPPPSAHAGPAAPRAEDAARVAARVRLVNFMLFLLAATPGAKHRSVVCV